MTGCFSSGELGVAREYSILVVWCRSNSEAASYHLFWSVARVEMLRSAPKNVQIVVRGQQKACYASPVPVIWRKGMNPRSPDRQFSPWKMHLYARYGKIIGNSNLLLLISTKDVPSSVLQKLRRALVGTAKPRSADNPFGIPVNSTIERHPPLLSAVRSHMFLAAMRNDTTLKPVHKQVVPLLQGQIAILTLPVLDPDHLAAVLKVLDRALPKPTANAPKSSPGRNEDPLAMPPPGGGGVQKAKPPTQPAIQILGGVVEGRLFYLEELQKVTKLPTLKVLHSQIVGLLSSPASQLKAVLQQAAGGRVVRTLDALRMSLEDSVDKP